MAEYSKKLIKMVDYEAMRAAFDEKFKETMQLIENGEDHLDNLAEGFHEADGVIFRMPTIDAVPVVRCKECKHWHEELGWCDRHSNFVDSDGAFCHPWESTEWTMFDADYFCKDGERRAENG